MRICDIPTPEICSDETISGRNDDMTTDDHLRRIKECRSSPARSVEAQPSPWSFYHRAQSFSNSSTTGPRTLVDDKVSPTSPFGVPPPDTHGAMSRVGAGHQAVRKREKDRAP